MAKAEYIRYMRKEWGLKETLARDVSKVNQRCALTKAICAGGCVTASLMTLVGLLLKAPYSHSFRGIGRILAAVSGCWGATEHCHEDRIITSLVKVDPTEDYQKECLINRNMLEKLQIGVPFVLLCLDVPMYFLSMSVSVPVEDISGVCSTKEYIVLCGVYVLEWTQLLTASVVIGVCVLAAFEHYMIYRKKMDTRLVTFIKERADNLRVRLEQDVRASVLNSTSSHYT